MDIQITISDELFREAFAIASKQDRALSDLVEEGLRLALERRESETKPRKKFEPPVSSAGGGVLPGVKLDNNAALLDLLDGIEPNSEDERADDD